MREIDKSEYIQNVLYGQEYFNDLSLILNFLNDSDEIVRLDMIEACDACKQEIIHEKLLDMLKTTNGLEKGYLLLTLSYIFQHNKEKIEPELLDSLNSTDEFEKLYAVMGLNILGYQEYLNILLNFFQSSEYYLRCSAINLIIELIQNNFLDEDSMAMVNNFLEKLNMTEKTKAVRSSMEKLFNIINQKMLK